MCPIAAAALTRIAALYRIEDEIRGRSAEERHAVRQERSRLLVEALEPWLRMKIQLISQKTKLAAAIRYTLSRRQGLCLFLDDCRIGIDNVVERSIRPIALTRKNALFAGSDGGADHWAVIASLIETCLIGVDTDTWPTSSPALSMAWPSSKLPRRTDALGISLCPRTQGRGLTTTLTMY